MTHVLLTSTDWALMRLVPGVALIVVFAALAGLAGLAGLAARSWDAFRIRLCRQGHRRMVVIRTAVTDKDPVSHN